MRQDGLRMILLAVVIAAVTVASQWALYRCTDVWPQDAGLPEVRRDTLLIRDTVRVTVPAPAEARETELRRVKLPLWSLYANKNSLTDSAMSVTVDSCGNRPAYPDSAEVAVPIEQKVFTDSVNYRAVVSGYGVCLDTIDIFTRREVVTIREAARAPCIIVGPAVGVGWNGRGVSPWVGVAVTVRVWGW